MNRLLLLWFFTFFGFLSIAQTRNIKMCVYFDVDKAVLRKDAKQTLDRLADSIKGLDIKRIVTKGNTDSDADSLYNQALSERRTDAVTNYLVTKKVAKSLFTKESFGELKPITSNDSDTGKQKNRRVEIIVVYTVKKEPKPAPVIEKKDTVPPKVISTPTVAKNPCTKDTIIKLKSGIELQFNLCEYLSMKDCLDIQEIMDPETAMNEGLTTEDVQMMPMASCGMINFEIASRSDCKVNCFNKPVKVRFPVPKSNCMPCSNGRLPRLFDVNDDGTWNRSEDQLKKVTIEGVDYYQYEVTCPSKRKNCDCRVEAKKVKLKTSRKYKIVSLQLSNDCPFTISSFKVKKYRKNVTKKSRIPCYMGTSKVHAVLLNRAGDTILVEGLTLDQLTKRKLFPRCKTNRILLWGFLPHKDGILFRKYKLKKGLVEKYTVIKKEEE